MELLVTATARDGAGVARAEDGRVIFVEGALAGETVIAEVIEIDKRWSRARVVEVLDPSPERVPVPCAHRLEGCGGCDLMHVGADFQLRMKAGIVIEQLRRSGVDAPSPSLRPLQDDQGRTTVRAAVVDGRAGYRVRGSHDIVVPEVCGAVDPLAEQLLVEGRFGNADEIDKVTIRVGNRTGERLVMVTGSTQHVSVPDDVLVVSSDELDAGRRAWIHEEAGGRRWRLSARSFFQNRPAGVDALVAEVAAMVDALGGPGQEAPLVDAYAGVGIFAGTIGRGRTVYAIERSRDSIADLRVNLDGSDVKISNAPVERWKALPASIVIADPAREGLGQAGVDALGRADPQLFVLVGCDPASFARDAGLLCSAGMRLKHVTVVDLFPDTTHIETVGAFARAGLSSGHVERGDIAAQP
ncbi:MAG: TRAM domain-containing protein [Acidimicrobiales bacterium]|nr:TRAM domain-containing protein [Acidimicrobiales bacterium]